MNTYWYFLLQLLQKFHGGVNGEVTTQEIFTIASDDRIKLIDSSTDNLNAVFKVFQSKVESHFDGLVISVGLILTSFFGFLCLLVIYLPT